MYLIFQDRFWFVFILFGNMIKFQFFTQFPTDNLYHQVASSLIFLLCKFAVFIIIIFLIISLCDFHTIFSKVFHWSLSDSKTHQAFRILLRILAVFNSAVVWMVLFLSLISSSTSLFYSLYIVSFFPFINRCSKHVLRQMTKRYGVNVSPCSTPATMSK